MREFNTAANRGKAGVPNAVDIEFKLDDDVLTAHAPTSGQVALFVQHGRGGGLSSVTSLFEFFSDVLEDDDWKLVEEKLRDGMDVELLAEISTFLIGEWSGQPYEAVVRLLAYAERYWTEIDGEAASRGADYLALPFDRFLNSIQWWIVQRVKDPERFKAELENPTGRLREVTEEDIAADGASFMAFASMMGVKPPAPNTDEAAPGDLPSS